MGLAVVMFGIVFFRLWFLQILSGQEFVAQANDNRLKSVKIAAPRGNIVDRRGEVIVENRGGSSSVSASWTWRRARSTRSSPGSLRT